MPFELPALPWSSDALDPHVSARTLSFHHGKHHATYVAKLNEAIEGSPFTKQSLDEIIKATAADPSKAGIFNNAAQTWNHTFFWNSMRPNGGGEPEGALKTKIVESFGSYEKFRDEFATKATTLFGSGWTWLAADGGKLTIVQTAGACNPMTDGKSPLLYQNRRPDFIKAFFDNLVNWEFAAENLSKLS
jgi:Fe-Mn family superoxide dismutase